METKVFEVLIICWSLMRQTLIWAPLLWIALRVFGRKFEWSGLLIRSVILFGMQQKTPFLQSKIWNLDIFWWMKHALSMMIIRKLLCISFGYVIMLRQCGSQILASTFCIKNSTGLLWILWKSCSKTARAFRLLCFLLLLGVYGSGEIIRENTNLHGRFMRLVPELRIWLWSISTYINKLPEWMYVVPWTINPLLLSIVTKLILMQRFLRTRAVLVLGWCTEIMKGMSLQH